LNSRILHVSTERKTALLAQFARVGKALANPARLQLLDLLIQAERSVEALAAAAGMPVGNTPALCEVARTHLPDAEAARAAYLGSDDHAEPVSRTELIRRAEAGDVYVIDVRPAEEYAAGHIPGAVSIPLGELPARLGELPATTEIVAYCRGAYCVLAPDAARLLRTSGRTARHLADGMLEWRLDGQPVAAA
jgi:rhodanese-related sulfurtransferase